MKDEIDFGKENVGHLFRKMFLPTLMGMLFMVVFIITDGIFVGQGIGSDALAAINFVSPLMLISTGVGLMFGLGASVVASIHMAKGKIKTARINLTQATLASTFILLMCSAAILVFSTQTLRLLGCPDSLMQLCKLYAFGFVPFLAINSLLCSGEFFIRLSGSPKYAMICSITASVLNIILDYLFIFIFKWGILGAAIATSTGIAVGSIMILVYLFKSDHLLHFVKIKTSINSLKLTFRNIGYMCRLGFSSLLGEVAISFTMICGNYVFLKYLGENGVAASSIYGYFSPLIFMVYNAIALSVQPIISFNYGTGDAKRVKKALSIALMTAVTCGTLLFLFTILFSSQICSMFIAQSSPVHVIASNGLPLSALCFIPLAVNIVTVCYLQSIEKAGIANIITLLRGFVFIYLCYIVLPQTYGATGAWLAVSASETITMTVALILLHIQNRKSKLHEKMMC